MVEPPDRASVVLQGFMGGIVRRADIAARLAAVIAEGLTASEEAAADHPFAARDIGEKWSIAGTGETCPIGMEIRKRDAAASWCGIDGAPAALSSATAAEKFAAVLAESAGNPEEVDRQRPFVVTDRGDNWLVRGSLNADRAIEGPGPFHLEVRKRDAKVLDMSNEWVMHTPPEVREILEAAKKPSPER